MNLELIKMVSKHITHPKDRLHNIVNFFLLFLNKSQKIPTYGFYNLAHSDVTVFHSFKPKVEKIFMNSNE